MGKAFRDLRAFRAASEDVTACKGFRAWGLSSYGP